MQSHNAPLDPDLTRTWRTGSAGVQQVPRGSGRWRLCLLAGYGVLLPAACHGFADGAASCQHLQGVMTMPRGPDRQCPGRIARTGGCTLRHRRPVREPASVGNCRAELALCTPHACSILPPWALLWWRSCVFAQAAAIGRPVLPPRRTPCSTGARGDGSGVSRSRSRSALSALQVSQATQATGHGS